MKKKTINKAASELGKKGGKKSVESRFKGKSKKQISEIMRKVRYSKTDSKKMAKHGDQFVTGLNKGAK
jgi:hypothetical protein